jgi:polar amino acid transport system substrate-binding protein
MRKPLLVIALLAMRLHCFPDEGVLIVTEEWAPYNYAQNGGVTGLSTEIVEGIMRILGERYPIELLPSMRAKALLDTRPKTILYSLFRTPEREQKYRWVGPILEEGIYFYKLRESLLSARTLDDIKRVNLIACRRAGVIHDLLVERGFSNLDESGTDSKQVYSKLLAKRCDLAISDTDIGIKYLFASMGKSPDVLERIDYPFFTSKLYIGFSKDFPDDEFARWEDAFAKLKQSGELARIIEKYY